MYEFCKLLMEENGASTKEQLDFECVWADASLMHTRAVNPAHSTWRVIRDGHAKSSKDLKAVTGEMHACPVGMGVLYDTDEDQFLLPTGKSELVN